MDFNSSCLRREVQQLREEVCIAHRDVVDKNAVLISHGSPRDSTRPSLSLHETTSAPMASTQIQVMQEIQKTTLRVVKPSIGDNYSRQEVS